MITKDTITRIRTVSAHPAVTRLRAARDIVRNAYPLCVEDFDGNLTPQAVRAATTILESISGPAQRATALEFVAYQVLHLASMAVTYADLQAEYAAYPQDSLYHGPNLAGTGCHYHGPFVITHTVWSKEVTPGRQSVVVSGHRWAAGMPEACTRDPEEPGLRVARDLVVCPGCGLDIT